MGLFSAMMASVSGMQAQANQLGTISDNIANANTTGYKEASAQFEDMLSQFGTTSYTPGGVATAIRYGISDQGGLTSTTFATDLAISGNGFFVVQDGSGNAFLSRAGNFTPNSSGELINSAGYKLLGYPVTSGSALLPGSVGQLTPVTLATSGLTATPSTAGTFDANLPSNAAVNTGTLPSANSAASTYTDKTSITAYDNLGNAVNLDVYFTKTGANSWDVDVYKAADAAPGGGFPYSSAALASQALTFDPTSGALTSPSPMAIPVPNGQTLNLDISKMTQLASSFSVSENSINGNAPASYSGVSISTDGTVSEVYSDGSIRAIAKIPLATVPSVDNLTSRAGDVFSVNTKSGQIVIGNADSAGFGTIQSRQLESSTVDLATQLTNMVVAQNAYSANSKSFQTGSDLVSNLIQMLK